MRGHALSRRLLLIFLLPPFAALAQTPPPPAVAITFDDLPFAFAPTRDNAQLAQMTTRLLRQLQAERVPAVGFVNEEKLSCAGKPDPARVELLRSWVAAGFELGNHTYSHVSLNRMSPDAFLADLLRGEAVTRPLMHSAGRGLRWFRYPYLHTGATPEARDAFRGMLAARGYREAPVSVNSSEWVFAAAYSKAQAQGDRAAARRIGEAYAPYMRGVFVWAEQLSLDLFGRPIPHVLLLHANSLNADYFGALAGMLKQRGYRFVTLDDALQDNAYATPPGFSGLEGESCLECWARQAGLRPAQPPPVPDFVRHRAGPAALECP